MRFMCAVCGDTNERNVRFVYFNKTDGIYYNVCKRCLRNRRVNDEATENWGLNVPAMYRGDVPEYAKDKRAISSPPSRLALCAPN